MVATSTNTPRIATTVIANHLTVFRRIDDRKVRNELDDFEDHVDERPDCKDFDKISSML